MICLLALAALAEGPPNRPLIEMTAGETVGVYLPRWVSGAQVTDPSVALVTSLGRPDPLRIQGVRPGTTDILLLFGPGVEPLLVDISVSPDLRLLDRTLDRVVPRQEPPPATAAVGRHVKLDPRVPISLAVGERVVVDVPEWLASGEAGARITDARVASAIGGHDVVVTGVTAGTTELMLIERSILHQRAAALVRLEVTPPR